MPEMNGNGQIKAKEVRRSRKKRCLICLGVTVGIGIVAAIGALIYFLSSDNESPSQPDFIVWPKPPDNKDFTYRFASVASANKDCSNHGTLTLADGGSAVDAWIATSLCMGILRSASCGIGGGGYITYYERATKRTYVLDYRDMAPIAAHKHMYAKGSNIDNRIGGGAIGVPGEVAGLWTMHQKFGRLPWKQLFKRAIKLAKSGVPLDRFSEKRFEVFDSYSKFDDNLREMFSDPVTKQRKKFGDMVKFDKLAETYQRLADGGIDSFYNGSLMRDIVADLQEFDGNLITEHDFRRYRVRERPVLKSVLHNGNFTVMSPSPPAGAIIFQYILKILDGFNFTAESVSPKISKIKSTALTYHRILEAMKFGFTKRLFLGDPDYIDTSELMANFSSPEYIEAIRKRIDSDRTFPPEYYGFVEEPRENTGTAQISVIAGNGDAVSSTTTINFYWGSKRMGRRTGIIFNDQMYDFAKPDARTWTDDGFRALSSGNNYIEPGKRPLSYMSPSIILDPNEDVRLVTGGAGGALLITASLMTAVNNLWLNQTLLEAVARPRLHHQLLPNRVLFEPNFPKVYIEELRNKGHIVDWMNNPAESSSCARENGKVMGGAEPRRFSRSDGF